MARCFVCDHHRAGAGTTHHPRVISANPCSPRWRAHSSSDILIVAACPTRTTTGANLCSLRWYARSRSHIFDLDRSLSAPLSRPSQHSGGTRARWWRSAVTPTLALMVLYQYLSWVGLAALQPTWPGAGLPSAAPAHPPSQNSTAQAVLARHRGAERGRSAVWREWLGAGGVSAEALWSTAVALLLCWSQVGCCWPRGGEGARGRGARGGGTPVLSSSAHVMSCSMHISRPPWRSSHSSVCRLSRVTGGPPAGCGHLCARCCRVGHRCDGLLESRCRAHPGDAPPCCSAHGLPQGPVTAARVLPECDAYTSDVVVHNPSGEG